MDNKEVVVFSVLIIGILCLFAGTIGMDYWEENQVRVMYQTAYQKNLDCRSSMKSSTASYITDVCGPIPKWEDYQK